MKTNVSNMHDLETRIRELEKLQLTQLEGLQDSAMGLAHSFSPARLLKSTFQEVAHSTDLRKTMLNTVIGLGAGYLGRKIIVGRSNNVFKKMAGSGLQFLIANFIRKKMPGSMTNETDKNN